MSKPVIEVENLSKLYHLGVVGATSFKESAEKIWEKISRKQIFKAKNLNNSPSFDDSQRGPKPNTFWALKDVSFSVKQGEVVGIIGRNGAGKSTLLKILSRITEPTSGRAVMRGRVASLLEVGTGFHPELTGRDNIFLNGAILGMRRREIERKFDEIVAFAEVEKFIDTPVKHYSSGMYVRLAFAVAAHLEPEILLVDEVLAVGDVGFQQKCLGKMGEVAKLGRTILFVSHAMAAVENLCDQAIVFKSGEIGFKGKVENGTSHYLKDFTVKSQQDDLSKRKREAGYETVIRKIELFNSSGEKTSSIAVCDCLTIKIHYQHHSPIKAPYFGLTFQTAMGMNIFWVQTKYQNQNLPDLPPSGVVSCQLPQVPLIPGKYFIHAGCGFRGAPLDYISQAKEIEILEKDIYKSGILPKPAAGHFIVNAKWEG